MKGIARVVRHSRRQGSEREDPRQRQLVGGTHRWTGQFIGFGAAQSFMAATNRVLAHIALIQMSPTCCARGVFLPLFARILWR